MSTHRSKDRSSLCSFMFVDGRHCRISRQLGWVAKKYRDAFLVSGIEAQK